MEAIARLGEALAERADALGLHLHTFAILPNLDGGPHTVQAVFVLHEDALKDQKELEEEAAFEELANQFKRQEAAETWEKREEEARARALRLLDELEGRAEDESS